MVGLYPTLKVRGTECQDKSFLAYLAQNFNTLSKHKLRFYILKNILYESSLLMSIRKFSFVLDSHLNILILY